MNIEIISKNMPEHEKAFREEIFAISETIKFMLQEKNITFKLVPCIFDLMGENNSKVIAQGYKYNLDMKKTTRGIMSDTKHHIAVSTNNTRVENIGAILYHELGHFIDIYEKYGKIESENDLIYSANEKFINAYKKDFVEHYELIKNDTNYRLKHFVQNNTPDAINQLSIAETFAELFRLANNKQNDTLTVELYFPTALNVLKELLNNKNLI